MEQDIRSIGLYRNKAKYIKQLCQMLIEKFNGEISRDTYEELIEIPGVGRKTANVVFVDSL